MKYIDKGIFLLLLVFYSSCATTSENSNEVANTDWWESAGAMKIVSLKPENKEIWAELISLDPEIASTQLDAIKSQGFTGIQIWGPPHSGAAYGGLDTYDNYNIDPSAGTNDQLKELIKIAQEKGLLVTFFINLSYFGLEALDWQKAQTDLNSEEHQWFLWSEDGEDSKPPYQEELFTDPDAFEWIYSETADKYFLGVWNDRNDSGKNPNLPQAYWGGSSTWAEEVGNIIDFWMDFGFDGVTIDAPDFYAGSTRNQQREFISNRIKQYGNKYIEAESAYGTSWINEVGYYGLWNYDLAELKSLIVDEQEVADVSNALAYRSSLVDNGGIGTLHLWFNEETERRTMELAMMVGVGDLAYIAGPQPYMLTNEEIGLLELKKEHPALFNNSKILSYNSIDNEALILVKQAHDNSEKILFIINAGDEPFQVDQNTSGIDTASLSRLWINDAESNDGIDPLVIKSFSYGFYSVNIN